MPAELPDMNDIIIVNHEEYPYVEDNELDEEWLSFLRHSSGKRKKVILCYTSISGLAQNVDTAIDKLSSVFDLFKENREEVIMYYHPDPAIFQFLEAYHKPLYDAYLSLIGRFIEEDYGIYDDGAYDDYFMVRLCDAFYGDCGYVMNHCMQAKKPVMVINYEIR